LLVAFGSGLADAAGFVGSGVAGGSPEEEFEFAGVEPDSVFAAEVEEQGLGASPEVFLRPAFGAVRADGAATLAFGDQILVVLYFGSGSGAGVAATNTSQ
jgi:hypothetical protein